MTANTPSTRRQKGKTCKQCGNIFVPKRYYKRRNGKIETIFCSRNCYFKNGVVGNRSKKIVVFCKYCRKQKELTPYYANKFKFCSSKCRAQVVKNSETWFKKKNPDRFCLTCGNKLKPNRKIYCCQKCYPRNDENNINWKGGLLTANQKIRGSTAYKIWRKMVFERDKYVCQLCGQVGGTLNADHIKPFSLYPKLRLDLNNGRTLCLKCHTKTESYLKAHYADKKI